MVTSILHRSVGEMPFFHWNGNYRGWGRVSGSPHTWSCMAPFYLHTYGFAPLTSFNGFLGVKCAQEADGHLHFAPFCR